jgi:hypothetical protein
MNCKWKILDCATVAFNERYSRSSFATYIPQILQGHSFWSTLKLKVRKLFRNVGDNRDDAVLQNNTSANTVMRN